MWAGLQRQRLGGKRGHNQYTEQERARAATTKKKKRGCHQWSGDRGRERRERVEKKGRGESRRLKQKDQLLFHV